MRKALFLDRDGVINKDFGYVHEIKKFKLTSGVMDACNYFQTLGYLIIIVTNQSGIARGYYSEKDYHHLTHHMVGLFKQHNISITAVYHCPHHPDYTGICQCRKPKPGMIYRAEAEHGIDLASSILVGDKESDIEAAHRANISQKVLLNEHPIQQTKADLIAASLHEFYLKFVNLNRSKAWNIVN